MSATTIGNQLMRLKPHKRRCPNCLGAITVMRGCGHRGVPTCDRCGFFPRGRPDSVESVLTFDERGIVNGCKPAIRGCAK